uniref:Vacuolar fusion protein MON1 homolog n=1 Tax=Astyanax mexicanus TaxID=7994 RepID=A0A3B1J5X2_ASTMX
MPKTSSCFLVNQSWLVGLDAAVQAQLKYEVFFAELFLNSRNQERFQNILIYGSIDSLLEEAEFPYTSSGHASPDHNALGKLDGSFHALVVVGFATTTPDTRTLVTEGDEVMTDGWRSRRKHVFVLSEAGKPIYSRHGSEEALSSVMGVMMALVSFVQVGGNTIQSIYSDGHTIVFMQKGPLVLVSASKSRQSELQLRSELLHVYHQIVSMLTQASINRIFQRRKNYDLRRLLFGSEKVIDGLLDVMESEAGFLLSAVQCLPLASSSRDVLNQVLQKAVTPNLVLSLLVTKGQLLSIVQEKMVIEDARLKPSDLHLLLNLIRASTSFQTGEIWTPVCLPRFNPDCYFYTYVTYLDPPECSVCLVLLSTDKEAFYAVAECKRKIEEGVRNNSVLQSISKAQPCQVRHVGVAELRHFLYMPFDVPDHYGQLSLSISSHHMVCYITILTIFKSENKIITKEQSNKKLRDK